MNFDRISKLIVLIRCIQVILIIEMNWIMNQANPNEFNQLASGETNEDQAHSSSFLFNEFELIKI